MSILLAAAALILAPSPQLLTSDPARRGGRLAAILPSCPQRAARRCQAFGLATTQLTSKYPTGSSAISVASQAQRVRYRAKVPPSAASPATSANSKEI